MSKIIAVTNYRYDKDYLEDWKSNLSPLVDDYVTFYDEDGFFYKDEGESRKMQYRAAREKGADWVVVIDVDERIEKKGIKEIRRHIDELDKQSNRRVVFRFNFRELYTPNKYRIDGAWGSKKRCAVFRLQDDNIYSDAKLHTPREPQNEDVQIIDMNINIYHLKHIKPELRTHRKNVYNKLDPKHVHQKMGYDYLDDETGITLKRIGLGRSYNPKYRDYKIDEKMFDL